MCNHESIIQVHIPSAITVILHIKRDYENHSIAISYQVKDGNENIVMVDDVNAIFPSNGDLPQYELKIGEV